MENAAELARLAPQQATCSGEAKQELGRKQRARNCGLSFADYMQQTISKESRVVFRGQNCFVRCFVIFDFCSDFFLEFNIFCPDSDSP